MYAKVFESIYDGSLRENWKALVTFQQFLVLADADGTVDMTPAAIAARTGIPREIIDAGIAALEAPDPDSRSAEREGRRIERLDDHRSWGWTIVNHRHYQLMVSAETKRAQTRERVKRLRHREMEAVTLGNACNATQTQIQTQITTQAPSEPSSVGASFQLPVKGDGVWTAPAERIEAWKRAFGVGLVEVEWNRMYAWLVGNPTRLKTRRGMLRFVAGWLLRAQGDRPGPRSRSASDEAYERANREGA